MKTTPPKNEVLELSLEFALEVIGELNRLPNTRSNNVLVKQCLRSGTSVGANIEEAVGANTKKEFIHYMIIARKEARETRYWLRLLLKTNEQYQDTLISLGQKATSLIKLLNAITKTSRSTS